jgi:hypothetical protein
MMYFRVNYRWADERVGHVRSDLQAKLMESGLVGGLDANVDGVVEPEELKGPATAALRAKFAELDKNHDGVLDAAEMKSAMPRRMARNRQETPDL